MRSLLRRLKSGELPLGPYRVGWKITRRGRPAPAGPAGPGPYKLHLGPGPNWSKPDASWLTVDVDPERGDVVADFNRREPFPLPDGSVTHVYGSHVFEHMSIFVTPFVFRECHRVLRPGGVFRLVLPDARRSIEAYLAGDADFQLFARRRRRAAEIWGFPDYTLFECLREDFLSRSGQPLLLGQDSLAHQNAWDYETISRDLTRAGFPDSGVVRSGFRSSGSPEFAWEGTFPSEANEDYRSLYVEAVK